MEKEEVKTNEDAAEYIADKLMDPGSDAVVNGVGYSDDGFSVTVDYVGTLKLRGEIELNGVVFKTNKKESEE